MDKFFPSPRNCQLEDTSGLVQTGKPGISTAELTQLAQLECLQLDGGEVQSLDVCEGSGGEEMLEAEHENSPAPHSRPPPGQAGLLACNTQAQSGEARAGPS